MTAGTVIGQTMHVAPSTQPPVGRRGEAMLPWQERPVTTTGDGALRKVPGRREPGQSLAQWTTYCQSYG